MLGYKKTDDKDTDGHIIYEINEAEAEIVRRIYREFLAGVPITRICKGLEADSIPTKLGKKKWHHTVVESILKNEKYTGNAILGKTFKADVVSKYRQKNTGQAPMYYVEGTHPAIIDKEMFALAQREIQRREAAKTEAIGSGRYTSKYPFSGLLICGECGHKLRRHVRTVGTRDKVPAWGCSNRITNGRDACKSRHIREDVLQRTYLAAIKQMTDDADEITETIKESAKLALEPNNIAAMEAVEQEIIEIQEAVLALHKSKQQGLVNAEKYASELQGYKDHMSDLEEKQSNMQTATVRYNEVRIWLDTFHAHVVSGDILNADDATLMKMLVDQIIVKNDSIEVQFKCGVIVEQEYVK